MSELKAKDSRVLSFPIDYVYRTITDIASYHKWWPREISFELEYLDPGVIGTIIDVHNGIFVRWKAKITGFKTNKLLAIDYVEGSWIGKTFWRFEEKDGRTELSLEIDLSINREWLKVVSKFMSFRKFHSKQIQKVFNNLEKYLAANEGLYIHTIRISHLDHIVLTVSDIEKTSMFYHRVLGMEIITFGGGLKALKFGNQKINLQEAGKELKPKADKPMPGSADICLVADTNIETVILELKSNNIEIVHGPVERTGAEGKIISVYIRDPDKNLVEIFNYMKSDKFNSA